MISTCKYFGMKFYRWMAFHQFAENAKVNFHFISHLVRFPQNLFVTKLYKMIFPKFVSIVKFFTQNPATFATSLTLCSCITLKVHQRPHNFLLRNILCHLFYHLACRILPVYFNISCDPLTLMLGIKLLAKKYDSFWKKNCHLTSMLRK